MSVKVLIPPSSLAQWLTIIELLSLILLLCHTPTPYWIGISPSYALWFYRPPLLGAYWDPPPLPARVPLLNSLTIISMCKALFSRGVMWPCYQLLLCMLWRINLLDYPLPGLVPFSGIWRFKLPIPTSFYLSALVLPVCPIYYGMVPLVIKNICMRLSLQPRLEYLWTLRLFTPPHASGYLGSGRGNCGSLGMIIETLSLLPGLIPQLWPLCLFS